MIGDFAKENEKFVNEKKVQQRREDAALPPWVGYHEEDILKDQILELSQVRWPYEFQARRTIWT